ncbi:MAG: hypothetical protein ACXWZS_12585 [Gemmatirosa sp.]
MRPIAAVPGVAAAPRAASGPDVIVLQRVTSPGRRDASSRARTERREVWRIGKDALVSRGGVVRLTVGAAKARAAQGASTAPDAARHAAARPPVPVLQLPALPASAVCGDAPAWERTSSVGGLTVVARGRGDVPWSTIEVWSQGRLMTRSQSTWERRRASWQLVAHEDVSVADGASSRVTVDRSAERRSASDVVVPSVTCADRKASIVRAAPRLGAGAAVGGATAWSAGPGPAGLAGLELAGAARFAGDECSPTEADAEAACEILRLVVAGAAASLVGTGATVWTACMPPAAFLGVPCLGAVAAHTAASVALTVAEAAYQECKREARAPAPTCSCPATPPPMDVGAHLEPGAIGTVLPVPAHRALDCTEPPPSTGGGGGGGGGGGEAGGGGEGGGGGGSGGWYEVCTYWDHFDEWGNYLGTEIEECHLEWID